MNKYHVQLQDGSFINSCGGVHITPYLQGAQFYSYKAARALVAAFAVQNAKLVKIVYDGSQTFPYSIK